MIDVHIITLPDTRRDWFDECLLSLEGEPVNVHRVDGTEGNIGIGRAQGFALGTSPLVSFVDPDDKVVPGGFAACEIALANNPDVGMAYTREALMLAEGSIYAEHPTERYTSHIDTRMEPDRAHHLTVYRRDALTPFLTSLPQYSYMPEMFAKSYVWEHHKFVFVDVLGYLWRKHPNNSHRTMNSEASKQERQEQLRWRDGLD